MTLGNNYRDMLDGERRKADAKEARRKNKHTKSLSNWFNQIAADLPAVMAEKVEAMKNGETGPSMNWTYLGDSGDFSSYRGEPYNKTDGFKAFMEACRKLDIDHDCQVEDGYNMIDDRIKELVLRLRPDKPYDETKSPDYVALGL